MTPVTEPQPQQAEFRPNFDNTCEVCEALPTVDVYVNEELVDRTGLCGVCTFGEADCLDPANW